MGRGLSKLQKDVLSLAYSRRHTLNTLTKRRWPGGQEEEKGEPVDLYTFEVLRDVFDFPCLLTDEVCLRYRNSSKFAPDAIGRKRYNSAKVSVSRTFLRLYERGLVVCLQGRYSRWSGIKLTDEGIEIAKQLNG